MFCKEDLLHFFAIPVLIGIIGGFSAILFRKAIGFFAHIFAAFDFLHTPYFYLLTMPALFYVSNLLISKFLIDQSNVTIDNVAKRIALLSGRFSHTRGAVVLLLSSFSIGFGAPVGREGPIAKLGGLGTELFLKAIRAQHVNVPIYLSAGVSAAIAATFNAPIAGIVFGLEIIIGKINSYIVIPLIVACSTATVFSDHFIGDFTAFYVPHLPYSDRYFWFVPIAAIFFAALSLTLLKLLRYFNKLRLRYAEMWKYRAAAVGLLVGLVIVAVPEAKGVGYDAVEKIFTQGYAAHVALEVTLAKLVIVALSIGSGIFGGLMSPSIVIGAFGGYWLGNLGLHWGLEPQVFALVGSAAMLAGVSKAPLRATIIITELTHSYQLMLPMLTAAAITGYMISKFETGGYFRRCLIQKGIDPDNSSVQEFFRTLDIRKYVAEIPPIRPETGLRKLRRLFRRYHTRYFAVVDEEQKLMGVVSLRDVRKSYLTHLQRNQKCREIMTPRPFVISEEYRQEDIVKAFSTLDANFVPFVDKEGRYLGMIDMDRLLKALSFLGQHYEIGERPRSL